MGCSNDVAAPVLVEPAAPAVPEPPELPELSEPPVAVGLALLFFQGDAVTVYITLVWDQVKTDPLGGAVIAVTTPVLCSVWVPFGGKLFGL